MGAHDLRLARSGAHAVGSRLMMASVAIRDACAVVDALPDPAHVVPVRGDRGEDVDARDEHIGWNAVEAVSDAVRSDAADVAVT